MLGKVVDAKGNARVVHDAAGRNSRGQDIWLLVRRGVHRMLGSRDVPPEPAGVEGGLGSSADQWSSAWETCTRRRAGQLLGPSSWRTAVVVAQRRRGSCGLRICRSF